MFSQVTNSQLIKTLNLRCRRCHATSTRISNCSVAESSVAEKLLVVRSVGVVNMEARLELTSATSPVALAGNRQGSEGTSLSLSSTNRHSEKIQLRPETDHMHHIHMFQCSIYIYPNLLLFKGLKQAQSLGFTSCAPSLAARAATSKLITQLVAVSLILCWLYYYTVFFCLSRFQKLVRVSVLETLGNRIRTPCLQMMP